MVIRGADIAAIFSFNTFEFTRLYSAMCVINCRLILDATLIVLEKNKISKKAQETTMLVRFFQLSSQ